MTHENNLIPGAIWYDPKSQRIIVIKAINTDSSEFAVDTITYRNIGTDTVYETSVNNFLDKFTWQSLSQK
jgi:hypothetical protein